MSEYVRQCVANLALWEREGAEIETRERRDSPGPVDFASAFPLSLPRPAETGTGSLRAAYEARCVRKRNRENRNSLV
jgi:hypothetical protein